MLQNTAFARAMLDEQERRVRELHKVSERRRATGSDGVARPRRKFGIRARDPLKAA